MQNYNPYLYVDQLSEKQLRDYIYSILEREKIQIEMSHISLFRYVIETDMMFYSYLDEKGKLTNASYSNYLKKRESDFFDLVSKDEMFQTIERILANPEENQRGALPLHGQDGKSVEIEYTVARNAEGNIVAIVGQLIDYLQTPQKLQETIRSLNDYIVMFEGLQNAYEVIISIDLQTFQYQIIKATDNLKEVARSASDSNQLARLFCLSLIDEKYRKDFMNFANPTTLSERIYGQKIIALDFPTRNLGWCHARLAPITYDADGNVTQAILTAETIADPSTQINYLRVAAERDGLTGLINRVAGERLINDKLADKIPSIFVLLDCDDFKFFNDNCGHPVGDMLLREIAIALQEVFPNDTIIRLGGDEFVVFIQNVKAWTSVDAFFGPLRERVKKISISYLKGMGITLSGGVTIYNGIFNTTFERLYHRADKALYFSKRGQKNTITVDEGDRMQGGNMYFG